MKKLIIYKEVDINESIEVDVDLTFDDIKKAFENCDEKEKTELLNILEKTNARVLEDLMKIELLKSNISKFSLTQFEKFINSL